MSVDTKRARELAKKAHRSYLFGEDVHAILTELADEVDRLRKEVFDYRDGFMEVSTKHDALLQAAKDHLDVAGCFESEPLCEAIEACEKGDHREHMDLCREQLIDLLKSRGEPTKLETLLAAAKVVMHGDSDSSQPYKVLRDAIRAYEEDGP